MLSTHTDAHREWHRNTGNLIGLTACPQDACDPHARPLTDDEVRRVRAYREAFEAAQAEAEADTRTCEHGLSAALCFGPMHY